MNEKTLGIDGQFPFKVIPYATSDTSIPFDIAEFNQLLFPIFSQINVLKQTKDSLITLERQLNTSERRIYDSLMYGYSHNVDSLIVAQTSKLQTEIENYESDISVLEKNRSELNHSQYSVHVADLKVKASQNALLIAQIKYKIYDDAVRNTMKYYDGVTISAYQKISDSLRDVSDSLQKIEKKTFELTTHISRLTTRYEENRKKKVTLLDFLYFSVLTSTSNSFGDIIPNSIWVRSLIIVQLLFSIFLLGVLIDSVKRKVDKKI
jgi:Ion channel